MSSGLLASDRQQIDRAGFLIISRYSSARLAAPEPKPQLIAEFENIKAGPHRDGPIEVETVPDGMVAEEADDDIRGAPPRRVAN
ncbi:hypothetical protein NKH60_33215 [Mesorhizobium sp. M1006]|uniref:hypothetical protein n=1 Tax=Mesorhizobium sp. M1006 TaxID=2957048 RepID=UPI00333C8B13